MIGRWAGLPFAVACFKRRANKRANRGGKGEARGLQLLLPGTRLKVQRGGAPDWCDRTFPCARGATDRQLEAGKIYLFFIFIFCLLLEVVLRIFMGADLSILLSLRSTSYILCFVCRRTLCFVKKGVLSLLVPPSLSGQLVQGT